MNENDQFKIGNLLCDFHKISNENNSGIIENYRKKLDINNVYRSFLGDFIADNSHINIKNNVLIIRTKEQLVKTELYLRKSQILENINSELGDGTIKSINIYRFY